MMNARPRTISLSTFAIAAALVTLMLMVGACTPAEDPAASAPTAAVEEASTTSTDDGTGADAEEETASEAPAQAGVESGDPASPVTVESAESLPTVVDASDPWFASLSPDGASIAYYTEDGRGRDRTGQICIFTFDGAVTNCYDLDSDLFQDYPYQLQWSPDSSMITFGENPIELANESDVWLMTAADGTFVNLTDDGVIGSWRQETGTPSPDVDYLPAWNLDDGQIYFWRFVSAGEYLQFNLSLYRIDPNGGEAELVRDVSEAVPLSLPIFGQEEFFLDGPSALSPDGRTVAVLLSTVDQMGLTQTSLWAIDLTDRSAEPRELMAPAAFNAAVPDWQQYPTLPLGLSWTADGQGVVVLAFSQATQTPFTVFYYVDVASGSATPLVDFSDLPDPEAYFEAAPGTDIPFRYYSPWTASLSPEGDKLLMVNDLGGVMGLLTASLPPDGALPIISATTDASTMSMASRSSRSVDRKVLVYGLLLDVIEE